jgi:hypothetical protein
MTDTDTDTDTGRTVWIAMEHAGYGGGDYVRQVFSTEQKALDAGYSKWDIDEFEVE